MFACVDLGGTKTLVAYAENGRELEEPARRDTNHDPEACLKNIIGMIEEVGLGRPVRSIGCSLPGPLDRLAGTCSGLNMQGWDQVPIGPTLSQYFNCPVAIEVDTDAAVLAEYSKRKDSCTHLFYMTISTGIGGGMMLHGSLYRGANQAHPEAGHTCISYKLPGNPNSVPCSCGASNCLEAISSGSAIQKHFAKPASELNADEWLMVAYNIGQGLRNVAVLYAPEVIVLGGGVTMGGGESLRAEAERIMRSQLGIVPAPKVELSRLGYLTALHGSYELAKQALVDSGDPS